MRGVRTYCNSKAASTYPSIPGVVFAVETDGGHAMLCCPQPGDYIPVFDHDQDVTNQRFGMAKIPLVLTNLHVRAAWRGEGMGTKLVKACQDFAERQDMPIVLRAMPYGRAKPLTLKELVRFYERCGFTHVGEHHRNTYMVWEAPT